MPWWSEFAGVESSAAVTAKSPEALESALFLDRRRVEGFIADARVVHEVLKMPEDLIARRAVLKPKPFLEQQKGHFRSSNAPASLKLAVNLKTTHQVTEFPEQQCSGLIEAACACGDCCNSFFISGAAMLRPH